MSNPTINPALLLSPAAEGYVAYDPAQDRVHRLNPLAALLLELCDGSRSAAQIRELAGPLIESARQDEIGRWIEDATGAGLLLHGPVKGEKLSAREQGKRALRSALFSASHLEDTTQIEAEYRARKNAVAQNPDDWDAWHDIGKIAQCLGNREEARAAYRRYSAAHPEDGQIEQVLLALGDEAPPPRTSDHAVQRIFKSFAPSYDARMRGDLGYVGPERTADAVAAVIGDRSGLTILDLGCGSGLSGRVIKPRAAHLVGVDLSPEMITLARARNIYDRLDVAEVTAWLDRDDTHFDLIISCDCLIYFGDLAPLLAAAAKRLKPDGVLAVSMERGGHYPFRLAETGRYTHHPDHVREAAAKAGLTVVYMKEGPLRTQGGEEVVGLYAVLGIGAG